MEEPLSLVIGVLQLALAALAIPHLGRFGRAFPWLAALSAFFVVRGATRVADAFGDTGSSALQLASDLLLVGMLVLLVAGLRRTVRGLKLAQEEAQVRKAEYGRALRDYNSLVRHRLANPITAIRGAVATLRDVPALESTQRDELLAMMEREARRLEEVALDPAVRSREERGLRPRPEVTRPGGEGSYAGTSL
jgi:signal transduction histidine kinase